jgi:hypothetical protein
MAKKYEVIVRRGAAYDDMKAGETVIDFSHMKANQRQVFIDNTVKYLKGKGYFNATAA